jgi:peroxiredoxin
LPSFTATLADGATFSNKDLQNGKPAILLFFRGHW